jgi:exopolysaccharide/PEP-CTERM locus tyrosine autokinase
VSIIERVAQLLEPLAQPDSSALGRAPKGPELDLIERSMASVLVMPPAAASQAAGRTAGPAATEAASRAPRIARSVTLDRARLRERGLIAPGGERSATAESFRRIKRRILANAVNSKANPPANLILVTSALAGEGKSFCTINLALSIALEVDHSVLLIDADVRKPSMPDLLGLKAGKGLMDLLVDRRLDMSEVLYRTDIGKLTLLPAGTFQANATELLASAATQELLAEMAARYRDRIVILDSPPLLLASETAVLASAVGQVIVVVESGKTTESALKEALGLIDSRRLTGLILNKSTSPGLGSYYGGYGTGA